MRGRMPRLGSALVLALSLSACGGGGSMVPPQGSSQPPIAVPHANQSVPVKFTITVPTAQTLGRVRPAYVSPSTQSATLSVASQSGGGTTTTTVNCTATCAATISAPIGSDTFSGKLFDAQNGGGNLLSTGSLTQTIIANQANTINATFNGVVKSIAVAFAGAQVTPGTAGSIGVTLKALDSDGNAIIGPGSYVDADGNPLNITLADSDTSGHSTLSSTMVTQPTTGITLNYDASFDANPTITASAPGLTANTTSALTFPAPTLTALSAPYAATSQGTVNETLTGTNFVTGNTTLSASSDVTISSVNVTNSTTLTATFNVAGASFGTQNVTATTPTGTTSILPFAIATGNLYTVNVTTDTVPGSPAGTGAGSGTGMVGDLRYAIVQANANAGSLITFSPSICGATTPCTIALAGPLFPQYHHRRRRVWECCD